MTVAFLALLSSILIRAFAGLDKDSIEKHLIGRDLHAESILFVARFIAFAFQSLGYSEKLARYWTYLANGHPHQV